MKTFYVSTRVMGGEWSNYCLMGVTQQFTDLASAMGMAATLASPIVEAMVGSIDTTVTETEGGSKLVHRTYAFVDLVRG